MLAFLLHRENNGKRQGAIVSDCESTAHVENRAVSSVVVRVSMSRSHFECLIPSANMARHLPRTSIPDMEPAEC